MQIALFSDIHSNLIALEAVLKDIDDKKPDAVYCLGDMVGYNIYPNEVINLIRERGMPAIAGNYDFGIGRGSHDCGCAYKTDKEKAMGAVSISYTNKVINEKERNYLRTLPAHFRIEFQLNSDKMNLLLVHGSPRRINEYLFEDRDEKSLLRIMKDADADIMCFGHTHKPFHRVVGSGGNGEHFRHAVNIGSVGKPKDGDNRACYVIVNINENSTAGNRESIHTEFIRVEYDIEKAARDVENSPLPKDYADMLRKAY